VGRGEGFYSTLPLRIVCENHAHRQRLPLFRPFACCAPREVLLWSCCDWTIIHGCLTCSNFASELVLKLKCTDGHSIANAKRVTSTGRMECSRCRACFAREVYSKKQLKQKGRRICPNCAEQGLSSEEAETAVVIAEVQQKVLFLVAPARVLDSHSSVMRSILLLFQFAQGKLSPQMVNPQRCVVLCCIMLVCCIWCLEESFFAD
jgi:hypothetical protein